MSIKKLENVLSKLIKEETKLKNEKNGGFIGIGHEGVKTLKKSGGMSNFAGVQGGMSNFAGVRGSGSNYAGVADGDSNGSISLNTWENQEQMKKKGYSRKGGRESGGRMAGGMTVGGRQSGGQANFAGVQGGLLMGGQANFAGVQGGLLMGGQANFAGVEGGQMKKKSVKTGVVPKALQLWTTHLKQYRKEHPNMTLREAMVGAHDTYADFKKSL